MPNKRMAETLTLLPYTPSEHFECPTCNSTGHIEARAPYEYRCTECQQRLIAVERPLEFVAISEGAQLPPKHQNDA